MGLSGHYAAACACRIGCAAGVRVSESAACCALVSVVTGWGGRGGGEASLVAKLILLSFQSLPRKSLKLSAGPSGARARYISHARHEACVISQYSGQLIPHTKISVHSIDTLTQDSPCSWRGYMSTKSDPNLRTPLATRARPLSCRARIRSQITEAPRYMRRPCRPGSRRPSCSRRSPASGTSRMVFWT